MAVENVTPDRNFNLPLESQLTGASLRMINQAGPYSFAGAGYQLLPDQSLGQIYMPGPNATLFGNNPFGLTPYGQGYFGGAYNSIGPQTQPGHTGYAGGNPFLGQSSYGYPQGQGYTGGSYNTVMPQQQASGQQQTFAGPSYGQSGFPYYDFARWQQGFYAGQQQNPYAQVGDYYNNPWPGYGAGQFGTTPAANAGANVGAGGGVAPAAPAYGTSSVSTYGAGAGTQPTPSAGAAPAQNGLQRTAALPFGAYSTTSPWRYAGAPSMGTSPFTQVSPGQNNYAQTVQPQQAQPKQQSSGRTLVKAGADSGKSAKKSSGSKK